MKINKISLQNFRAFDEPFELNLDGGKNLLLHGENGSGKSSIFTAIKRFFEERGDKIDDHRNHFAPATRAPEVRLHFKGKDPLGTEQELESHWDAADGHPLPVPNYQSNSPIPAHLRSILVDGSRRSGFVDYRMMLRTHLLSSPLPRVNWGPQNHNAIYGMERKGLEAQLFDLVTLVVLAGVRTTIAGGVETTIGTLMREVWEHRPAYRYKTDLRWANHYTNTFNQAFNAKLPELEAKLAKFLDAFEHHHLNVKFRPTSLTWDKPTLTLKGAELVPEITFRGKVVNDHPQCLNEARLSAIANCLFFAGVALSDNDFVNPNYPRFLVLDDALIGLDLENRLPILRILTSETFKNYQIFLLTHDRVWFDLACGHLRENNCWLHKELLAEESTGKLIPRLRSAEADLDRARRHLANGDLKAAAVYARSAYEWRLRHVCKEFGVEIPFKPDADKIGAGVLWDGIIKRQRDRENQRTHGSQVSDFVPKSLEVAVETMRSTVLNRLSHANSSGLVNAEVNAAIDTVQMIHDHTFLKK